MHSAQEEEGTKRGEGGGDVAVFWGVGAACDQRGEFGREAGFGASVVPSERLHVLQIDGPGGATGDGGMWSEVGGKRGSASSDSWDAARGCGKGLTPRTMAVSCC